MKKVVNYYNVNYKLNRRKFRRVKISKVLKINLQMPKYFSSHLHTNNYGIHVKFSLHGIKIHLFASSSYLSFFCLFN